MSPVRVVVVSSIRLYREGLCQALQGHSRVGFIGGYADITTCTAAGSATDVDAVLIDAQSITTPMALSDLRSSRPGARIIALSFTASLEEAMRCIQAGVDGIAGQDATIEEILDAFGRIDRNEFTLPAPAAALLRQLVSSHGTPVQLGSRLTKMEQRVAALAATGLINKRIAERLDVDVSTVKHHLHNIFQKLGVRRRAELAALFWASGRGADPLELSRVL